MKILSNPDGIVFRTLGEMRLPENGSILRPSLFAVPYDINGRKLVFNTLTRQTVEAPELFELFENKSVFPFDDGNADIAKLVRLRFIVPKDADEVKSYLGIVEVIRLFTKKNTLGHKGYVILPTTACNARCFYCYESGIEFKSMDDKTADDAVDYIVRTKSDDSVRIQWFGGEPLLGEAVIDRICAGLQKKGIDYASTIITNGSLITPELAEKMRTVWNINNAQITLDGTREEYLRRKAYVSGYEDAYERVMNGIGLLLDVGIRVSIRLNADDENIDDLFLLADELKQRFGGYKHVFVYPRSLFSGCGAVKRGKSVPLHGRVFELYKKLYELGLSTSKSDHGLRPYFCMADIPNGASAIAPDGRLFACEHMSAENEIGSIYDYDEEWERRSRFIETNRRVNKCPECIDCPFMPQCTVSAHCPVEDEDCISMLRFHTAQLLLKYAYDKR